MTTPPYCAPHKKENIFRLLLFSTITKTYNNQTTPTVDEEIVIKDLQSLGNSSPNIILPHLYRNAIRYGIYDKLTSKAQTLLRDTTYRLIAADIKNTQWVTNHLKSFEKAKIPVILLKSAAFARSIYPENTPRLGVDIDLLVTRENFEPACSLISQSMNPILLDNKRLITHETLFERVFTPKKGKTPTVEIHWGLTNPLIFTIEEKNLWQDSRQHPAYDSEYIRILSPEDTLLHLAVHAFRDLDFCTHNLLDAHEVWCQWKPDPGVLVERASQWGAKKVLYYLLVNCQATMETPFPESMLNNLQPSPLSNKINKSILQSSGNTSPRFRLIQLLSQITFPDKISNGIKFQLSYLRTRIKDWLAAAGKQQKSP